MERWALVGVAVASAAALTAWLSRDLGAAPGPHRIQTLSRRSPVLMIQVGIVLVLLPALIGAGSSRGLQVPLTWLVTLLEVCLILGELLVAAGLAALARLPEEGFTDAVLMGGGVTGVLVALVGVGSLSTPMATGPLNQPLVPLVVILTCAIAASTQLLRVVAVGRQQAPLGPLAASSTALLLAATWFAPASSPPGQVPLWGSATANLLLAMAMVQLVATARWWPGSLLVTDQLRVRQGMGAALIAVVGMAAVTVRTIMDDHRVVVGRGIAMNPRLAHHDEVAWLLAVFLLLAMATALAQARQTRRRISQDLATVRAQWDAVADLSDHVVIELDARARVRSANHAAVSMLHRAPEALVGMSVSDLVVWADHQNTWQVSAEVARGELDSARLVVSLAPPAAGNADLRMRAVPDGAVVIMTEATDVSVLREHLSVAARYDSATGLVNRHQIVEEVTAWIDQGRASAMLFIDLDRFRGINARFGRDAGDAVLAGVARRLQVWARNWSEQSSGRAVVARIVADEFAIALPDTDRAAGVRAAEEIGSDLLGSFQVDGHRLKVSAGIGVAATDDGNDTHPEVSGAHRSVDLLERADLAATAAKALGRSQVTVWEPQLAERARRAVDVAIGLRRALETGRLDVAFQPIVRLSDGVVVGLEALIRVPRRASAPTAVVAALGGDGDLELADLVTPAELVEIAEITGEIDELGHWVLSEAVRQAAHWHALGHDVRLNVNMSVRQLSHPGFPDVVRATLARFGLAPGRLTIEITEGQLLGEGERADNTIQQLRREGVSLAIDDLGSGYSSLSYLRRMPVKTVKIDRSLLAGVGHDARANTVVRAVINAARGLGMLVVCEGIEDLATARTVRDLGAWAGQGYALYPAMDAVRVLDVLDRPPVDLSASNVSRSEMA